LLGLVGSQNGVPNSFQMSFFGHGMNKLRILKLLKTDEPKSNPRDS